MMRLWGDCKMGTGWGWGEDLREGGGEKERVLGWVDRRTLHTLVYILILYI
jgi:hypothetical protein